MTFENVSGGEVVKQIEITAAPAEDVRWFCVLLGFGYERPIR